MPYLFSLTKKLWKSAVCAVAKYRYYGIKDDYTWCLSSHENPTHLRWFLPKLFQDSELVWCQGPQGGVRLLHYDWHKSFRTGFRTHGYITNNAQAMQEFMWVKLKAQDISVK